MPSFLAFGRSGLSESRSRPYLKFYRPIQVSGSISASTPACHAGERGSTPRQRDSFFLFFVLARFSVYPHSQKVYPGRVPTNHITPLERSATLEQIPMNYLVSVATFEAGFPRMDFVDMGLSAGMAKPRKPIKQFMKP